MKASECKISFSEKLIIISYFSFLSVLFCESVRKLGEMLFTLSSESSHEIGKQTRLHVYEMNCLINFVDSNSTLTEILSLVPSLSRFREDDIEEAINIVKDGKRQITGEDF